MRRVFLLGALLGLLGAPSFLLGQGDGDGGPEPIGAEYAVYRCFASSFGIFDGQEIYQCNDYSTSDCQFLTSGIYAVAPGHNYPQTCGGACDRVEAVETIAVKTKVFPGLAEKKCALYEHEFEKAKMNRLSHRVGHKQYVTFQAMLPQPNGGIAEETVHALLFTYIVDVSGDNDTEPRWEIVRHAFEVEVSTSDAAKDLPSCFDHPIALSGHVEPQLGGNFFKITDGKSSPAIFAVIKTRPDNPTPAKPTPAKPEVKDK